MSPSELQLKLDILNLKRKERDKITFFKKIYCKFRKTGGRSDNFMKN